MKIRIKSKRYVWHPEIFCKNMLSLIGALAIIWVIFSYIQVLLHSGDGLNGMAFQYPSYNFFKTVDIIGNYFMPR